MVIKILLISPTPTYTYTFIYIQQANKLNKITYKLTPNNHEKKEGDIKVRDKAQKMQTKTRKSWFVRRAIHLFL